MFVVVHLHISKHVFSREANTFSLFLFSSFNNFSQPSAKEQRFAFHTYSPIAGNPYQVVQQQFLTTVITWFNNSYNMVASCCVAVHIFCFKLLVNIKLLQPLRFACRAQSNGEEAFPPAKYQSLLGGSVLPSNAFVTYTINWQPGGVAWYANGNLLRIIRTGDWVQLPEWLGNVT